MSWTRHAKALSTLLLVVSGQSSQTIADEQPPIPSKRELLTTVSRPLSLLSDFRLDLSGLSKTLLASRVEMAPHARMTRSYRPLRQVSLVGGDRFVAECLEWGSDFATFRFIDGQTIRVPHAAVAALTNPPGEVDVIDESFEAGSVIELDPTTLPKMLDETQAADGRRSLRIDSALSEYRKSLPQPLTSARIEFSFRISDGDRFGGCGEWQLEWSDNDVQQPPVVVRISSDRQISATGTPRATDTTSQPLGITAGWHSFIAIVTPERTRLIVDDAILAAFPTPHASIRTIRFRPGEAESKNVLWIDEFHVRSLKHVEEPDPIGNNGIDSDVIRLATGDELFGRLSGLSRSSVSFEVLKEQHLLPWSQIEGLAWQQPSKPVQQTTRPMTGVVSQIELQSFVDRPDCKADRLTVTVLKSDSKVVVAQHSLLSELTFRWSDIRRVDSLFFGQTLLVDARRFHLGNSIRPDFHRHLPDGSELQINFPLQEIPRGQAYLSLDVAELEAAGPTAPPGSPFLAQLRAGQLITEVLVNDQKVGPLNSLIRFKATSQNPDRVRIAIPQGMLKLGENSLRLHQQPLKYPGREFDDCEVGNFRLEFDF